MWGRVCKRKIGQWGGFHGAQVVMEGEHCKDEDNSIATYKALVALLMAQLRAKSRRLKESQQKVTAFPALA
jgi:hypothetical protein